MQRYRKKIEMSNPKAKEFERSRLLSKVVSGWDSDDGAGECGVTSAESGTLLKDALPLTNAEIAHMQVRVIALENLLKVLLSDASKDQVELMRDMAAFISPRPGFTQHPLTIQAAACMINLVESAGHLRDHRLCPTNIDDSSP